MKKTIDAAISTSEAAVLLKLSARRTRELCESGFIDRLADDRVTIRAAVWGWIAFGWKATDGKLRAMLEGKRFREARAHSVELKNAEREAKLIDIVEHRDCFVEVIGTLKAGLDSIPAQVTQDRATRDKIEAAINDVLRKAADRFERATAEMVEGAKSGARRRR